MQEIISRISNLSLEANDEEAETLLNELKTSLIQNQDLSQSILNLNFIKTLESFIETDSLTLTCCDILDLSLAQYKLIGSESFGIIELLLKSNPLLTKVAIKKLQHDCKEISSNIIPKSTILLLINCLKSQHVNIGPPTINLLIAFLHDNLLDDNDIKHQLIKCLESSNTEVTCRVYDVCVGIATKQFSSFEKVRFILDNSLNELASGSDVLLQLNLLEILQSLCLKDYGFSYFENKGVLRIMANKLEAINEDPLEVLLVPGLMKFFGAIASAYPQKIFQNYTSLFELLFNCPLDGQSSMLYPALDTIGYLSRSNECKKMIDEQFGEKFSYLLNHIYHNISNYPSDAKLRAFWCLENVFAIEDTTGMINNQITRICKKWGSKIFENSSDFSSLLNFCKTPFDDLSQASFGFLKSIARHTFGQQLIAQSAGFVEFLLDRKIGTSFELKQKKYEIIEILSASNEFDAQTIAQFCKYVREGVNFVEPMSEVSFEAT